MEEINIYLATINISICIFTIIGNIFILTAVIRAPQLHTPSNILLCNRAIADLGVGLFAQPIFISFQLLGNSGKLKPVLDASILVFAGVSMAGMALMSLDRYLALSLHLRYRAIVTIRRTFKAVGMLWAEAGIVLAIYLARLGIIPLIGTLGAFLCFTISMLAYIRIYIIVRRHKRQIKNQNTSLSPTVHSAPLPRHGKSIKTMYIVNGLFVLSWLPIVLLVVTRRWVTFVAGKEGYQYIENTTILLFLSNSLANPILYCWRVRQIRDAVIKLIRKIHRRKVSDLTR